jgi:hypothetical protein
MVKDAEPKKVAPTSKKSDQNHGHNNHDQDHNNLDQAWASTVLQLAQQGNAKAITFWLNRTLLPQRICAQVVASDDPRTIAIHLLAHQPPDRQQLIELIRDRFATLNATGIQTVHLEARIVGAKKLAWKTAVDLEPSLLAEPAIVQSAAKTLVSKSSDLCESVYETVTDIDEAIDEKVDAGVQAIAALTAAQQQAVQSALHSIAAKAPSRPQPLWKRLSRTVKTSFQRTVHSISAIELPEFPELPELPTLSFHSPKASLQSVGKLGKMTGRWTERCATGVVRRSQQLHKRTVQSGKRSFRWFKAQPLPKQAGIISGAVLAIVLVGTGSQLLLDYIATQQFQLSPNAKADGRVKTASGYIPVIQQPVLNPDDPTVSLLFSSGSALGESSGVPYRQADVLMTGVSRLLDDGLGSAAPVATVAVSANDSMSGDQSDSELTDESLNESMSESSGGSSDESTVTADSTASASQAQLSLQSLVDNGVDVVNLAGGRYTEANSTAIASLQQNAIYPIGVTSDRPFTERPVVMSVKGKRIAYLAYTDASIHVQNNATENAKPTGLNTALTQQIDADIQALRSQVDFIVVSFHWSRELHAYPEPWQINLAHFAVDGGADLIVGYQPGDTPITQGAEIYQGRAIAYSLGNAIDDYTDKPKGDYDTAILKASLQGDKLNLTFLPVQVRNGQVNVADPEASDTILRYMTQASSLFDQPLRSPITLDLKSRTVPPATASPQAGEG